MQRINWFRNSLGMMCLVALLSACGDGDGNGGILIGNSNSGASLNQQTADQLMRGVLFDSEKILQLSQVAVNAAELILQNDLMTVTVNCAGGGSTSTEVVDADNNRQLSAGDSIVINYASCFESVFAASLLGELEVTVIDANLINEVNGLAQLQSLRADLQTEGSLSIDSTSNPLTIDAQFELRFDQSGATNLTAQAGNDRSTVVSSNGVSETYFNFDLQKNVAELEDRYELSLQLTANSERFDTTLRCNDFALLGNIDFAPDTGELVCRAEDNTAVKLTADGIPALQIDAGGDGVFVILDQPSRLFNDSVQGFLYARP